MPDTDFTLVEARCNQCSKGLQQPGLAYITLPLGQFVLLIVSCPHCGYVIHTSVVGLNQPTIVRPV